MSSEAALTKSRVDLQKLIKTSQAQIRESLGALEAATASLANSEQIQHELQNLRESLTCLWFACDEAMNRHKRLKD